MSCDLLIIVVCKGFNCLQQCNDLHCGKIDCCTRHVPGWWLKVSSMPVYNQECLVNPNPQILLFPLFFRWRSTTMPCNFLYTDVEQTANSLPFPSPSGINSPTSEFANTSGSWRWSRSQPTRMLRSIVTVWCCLQQIRHLHGIELTVVTAEWHRPISFSDARWWSQQQKS